MEQKKKTANNSQTRADAPSGSAPEADNPNASQRLLEAARGWGAVAREANERNLSGAQADAELRLRRNRSGQ